MKVLRAGEARTPVLEAGRYILYYRALRAARPLACFAMQAAKSCEKLHFGIYNFILRKENKLMYTMKRSYSDNSIRVERGNIKELLSKAISYMENPDCIEIKIYEDESGKLILDWFANE